MNPRRYSLSNVIMMNQKIHRSTSCLPSKPNTPPTLILNHKWDHTQFYRDSIWNHMNQFTIIRYSIKHWVVRWLSLTTRITSSEWMSILLLISLSGLAQIIILELCQSLNTSLNLRDTKSRLSQSTILPVKLINTSYSSDSKLP